MEAVLERIPLAPSESFRCREFRLPFFPAPWHHHPEYELTLILASRGTRFVGDKIEHYEPGDLALIGPHLPHCWINAPLPPGEEAASVVVQFKTDFLGAEFFGVRELLGVRRMLDRAARGLSFRHADRLPATRTLRNLPNAHGALRVARLIEVLSELALATSEVLSSPGFVPDLRGTDDGRIDRVHRFLLEHFAEPVRLEEVAAIAHMSPAAFCRYFKQRTGKTFVTALNDIRIGHACRLLLDEDVNASEAAFRSGYGNLSHFHRQFARRMGTSPLAYRQKHAESRGPAFGKGSELGAILGDLKGGWVHPDASTRSVDEEAIAGADPIEETSDL